MDGNPAGMVDVIDGTEDTLQTSIAPDDPRSHADRTRREASCRRPKEVTSATRCPSRRRTRPTAWA